MITSIAGLALAAQLLAGQFGLSASPAAYHHALPNHTYAIRITNIGDAPLTVYSGLSRATEQAGHCTLDSSHPDAYGWAHYDGPPVFSLRPGQSVRVRIRITTPPPGRTQLVATFTSRTSGHGQVATSAGVGTSLRFAQPGRTRVPPCPLAVKAASRGGAGRWLGLTLAVAVALGLAALGYVARRGRRRGRHAA